MLWICSKPGRSGMRLILSLSSRRIGREVKAWDLKGKAFHSALCLLFIPLPRSLPTCKTISASQNVQILTCSPGTLSLLEQTGSSVQWGLLLSSLLLWRNCVCSLGTRTWEFLFFLDLISGFNYLLSTFCTLAFPPRSSRWGVWFSLSTTGFF